MKSTQTPFHKSHFAKIYPQTFVSMMSLIRLALVTAIFFAVIVIMIGEQVGSTASTSTPPLSAPPPTCTQPPNDVIDWWSGEGNGSPEIGTYTAVLGNGAQYGPGIVGQAFQFDGVNDFVDIGQHGALPTYTVALWFNADIADQNRTFISQDRAGYNDDFMLGIEPEHDFYGDDFRRITVVFHDDATQSRYKIRDTVDADPGRWYFVAVTYDGTTMRLWVDGVEKGNVTANGLGTSDQQWNLGQNSHFFPSGVYRNFAGRIDEPIIARRAYTQSEINAIYLAGPSGICPPSPTCTQPPNDVIAWWSGEGNESPEIGTYTAVLGNGAQYGPGIVGQAFQFDGVNDFVDIGQHGALPTYTVALWFNADIVDTNRTFISQDRAGTNDDFMLGIEPEGHNYTNDFRRITVVFHDDATQSRYKIRDTVDADPGRWYFVAVTYDGTTMRLWVDGVEKGNVTANGLGTSDQQWNLGQNSHFFPSGSYRNFAGRIDEPIIASRAFTQSELNAIYLSGPTGICRDIIAPTTNAATTPPANGAGWNNSDVSVSLASSDNAGGTGVSEITFSATGAQPIAPTTVNGASVDLSITAEGETTITYFARDAAGNEEAAQSLVIKIDSSAPSVSCDSADGSWHANDVRIPCTANDGVSGLSNAADGSFNLTTNVTGNTETSNASTDSRTVCDVAGNCATAGPISGNKVDKKAPTITITTPSPGASYLLNQPVVSSYTCSDGGSGVGTCAGPVANGSNIDTASAGNKDFTVNASDAVGNTNSATNSCTVRLPQLTAFNPAQIWLGLKNSDDVGTKFDLLAEAFRNGALIGSGQLNDVPGGSSGFNNASLIVINMALPQATGIGPGDTLSLRLSVRIAASSGHVSGTARLWFNDSAVVDACAENCEVIANRRSELLPRCGRST
jgi:hypothetical protein